MVLPLGNEVECEKVQDFDNIKVTHNASSVTPINCTGTVLKESDTYLDTWNGFEAAKTAPWPSRGLHHCGKFFEPSNE